MKSHTVSLLIVATVSIPLLVTVGHGTAEPAVPLYGVHELVFAGPVRGPADNPTRDVELVTQWRHESGRPVYTIQGFWDGDGKGGASGPVFKVRFCPTQEGQMDPRRGDLEQARAPRPAPGLRCDLHRLGSAWVLGRGSRASRRTLVPAVQRLAPLHLWQHNVQLPVRVQRQRAQRRQCRRRHPGQRRVLQEGALLDHRRPLSAPAGQALPRRFRPAHGQRQLLPSAESGVVSPARGPGRADRRARTI